jgi:hypothetical protein
MNCNAPGCNATAVHLIGEYWFCAKCGPHSVGCRCSYCKPIPLGRTSVISDAEMAGWQRAVTTPKCDECGYPVTAHGNECK